MSLKYQTHKSLALFADAAVATRYTFVKPGSIANHCVPCASIADEPIGIVTDDNVITNQITGVATSSQTDVPLNVELLGGSIGTRWALAGNVINNQDDIVMGIATIAGVGTSLPVAMSLQTIGASVPAKTYWKVGTAAADVAAGTGDGIEFQPCLPVQVTL
jgi:hypothetical protein